MRFIARPFALVIGAPVLAAGWIYAQTTAPSAPTNLTAAAVPSPSASGTEPRPVVLYVQERDAVSRGAPYYAASPYYGGYPQPQPVQDAAQLVSCVVQVDLDGNVADGGARPDAQSVGALVTSTTLLDVAAEKALQLKPDQRRELVVVNAYPAGFRFTKLEVALRKSDAVQFKPGAATDLLKAICDGLKVAYEESATAQRKLVASRREQAEKDLQTTRTRAAELRQKLRAVRDLLGANDGGDPSYAIRNLRQQRQSIEQELNRSRARLAAIDPSAGPLVAEWESVVKLREQRLAELKKRAEAKQPVSSELSEAEAKLAEAKAQLATARQNPGVDPSVRQSRSSELSSMRAQIAESEARLKPIAEQLAKLDDPANAAAIDGYQDLQQEEQRARNAVNEAMNRLEMIRQQTRLDPAVSVTVLDGKAD